MDANAMLTLLSVLSFAALLLTWVTAPLRTPVHTTHAASAPDTAQSTVVVA